LPAAGASSAIAIYGHYLPHWLHGRWGSPQRNDWGARARCLHRPLLDRIQKGEIDPSFVITHKMKLDDAPHGYEIFNNKKDNCIKIVLKP